MSVPGLRKPALAATGCCFLLLLCASSCMSQVYYHGLEEHFFSPYYGSQAPQVLVYQTRNGQPTNGYEQQPQTPSYQVNEPIAQLGGQNKQQVSPGAPGNQSPRVNGQSGQSNGDLPQAFSQSGQSANPPSRGNRQPEQSNGASPPSAYLKQQKPRTPSSGANAPSLASDYTRQSQQDDAITFPRNPNPQRDTAPSQPSPGALQFAWKMLTAHILPQPANSAVCPILPQMLLASLYDVADSGAKSELQGVLQARPKELQRALSQQLLATNQSAANQLDYASTFFIGADTKISPSFYNQAAQEGVTFQPVDFRNRNAAANVANRWVTEKTRGIIREILAPANLDPATRLMMASVIYFKGKWKFQFTKTEPATFESDPRTSKQVQMMYQYNKFRYGEIDFQSGNGFQWVDLPYEGSSGLSMVLMLPKVRHQLQNSLQELSLNDMQEMMTSLTEPRGTNKVHLYVPRFGVFSSSSLLPALKNLGLKAIFDRPAALAGLANEELVVRDVSQRTYIAVDEKGTTATSVAALSFVALSAAPPPPTINFTVDQPFVAMIMDKKSAYPMFVAKVLTPEEIQA